MSPVQSFTEKQALEYMTAYYPAWKRVWAKAAFKRACSGRYAPNWFWSVFK